MQIETIVFDKSQETRAAQATLYRYCGIIDTCLDVDTIGLVSPMTGLHDTTAVLDTMQTEVCNHPWLFEGRILMVSSCSIYNWDAECEMKQKAQILIE